VADIGWGGAIAAGAVAGFASGVTGAALNGANLEQSLKAGLIGGATGAAFGWAGGVGGSGLDGANSVSRYLAHAAVGCASSLAGGGGSEGCARGAASAVIGKAVTNLTQSWGVGVAQFTAATVAGGVTSRVMGGSFESGATTAAYGYLFNHVLSKLIVGELFKKPGHHAFTRSWANDGEIKPYLSGEAVDFAGKNTMGENVKWEGEHPNRWSNTTGHPEYSNGSGRQMVLDYIAEKKITQENPMDIKQMAELMDRLKAHPFNVSVQNYINEQTNSGNMFIGRYGRYPKINGIKSLD
jgi:hypothetical protein